MTRHDDPYAGSTARYYDLFWTGPGRLLAHGIQVLLEPTVPSRILDLCCGGGQTIEILVGQGHTVTGLDLSEPMIDIARERLAVPIAAGRVTLVTGDMCAFDLGEKFDVITCTYWSLNHLQGPAVQRALGCIARHLSPRGVFVTHVMSKLGERTRDGLIQTKDEAGGTLTRIHVHLPDDGGMLLFHRGHGVGPGGEIVPFRFKVVVHGHDAENISAELRHEGLGHSRVLRIDQTQAFVQEIRTHEPCEEYVLIASQQPLDFITPRIPIVTKMLRNPALRQS